MCSERTEKRCEDNKNLAKKQEKAEKVAKHGKFWGTLFG